MKKITILLMLVFSMAMLWGGFMATVAAFEVDSLASSAKLVVFSIVLMSTGFLSIFMAVDVHRGN